MVPGFLALTQMEGTIGKTRKLRNKQIIINFDNSKKSANNIVIDNYRERVEITLYWVVRENLKDKKMKGTIAGDFQGHDSRGKTRACLKAQGQESLTHQGTKNFTTCHEKCGLQTSIISVLWKL